MDLRMTVALVVMVILLVVDIAAPARPGKMVLKPDKIAGPTASDLSEVTEINPKSEPAVKITVRANVGLSFTDGNTNTGSTYLDWDNQPSLETKKTNHKLCRNSIFGDVYMFNSYFL